MRNWLSHGAPGVVAALIRLSDRVGLVRSAGRAMNFGLDC
jgi:hypothetical protein